MRRSLPVVAVLAGTVGTLAQAAPAEDDLVLLKPYLDQESLGDGLDAYLVGDRVLVPLGEICRLLGFGITVGPTRTTAAGFFIQPKRSFRLDLASGTVSVAGRPAPLGRAVAMPRDLYVDAASLGQWFPLEVKVGLKDSDLVIHPLERLPVQDAWERERKYRSAPPTGVGEEAPPGFVAKPIPYTLFDLPVADLNLSVTRNQPASTLTTGSATLAGDLAWMSSDIYAYRDADGSWRDSRYTLFREDPGGRLLGPLRARNLDLGDLPTTPTMDLAGTLPSGRGLNVDNYPITYGTRFGARTFSGNLAEGWSVECYQNGSLAAFQRSRADGRYEFKDVPLRFGVNLFRLVFHGPAGEQLVQTYRLEYAQDQPGPGTFYYGLSVVRPTGQYLVPSSSTQDSGGSLPVRDHYLFRADYGLSNAWSVQAARAGMELEDGFHQYQSLGLKMVRSFMALHVTGAMDRGPAAKPGRALEAALGTGLGYSTLTVRRDQFWDGYQRSESDPDSLGATGLLVRDATGLGLDVAGRIRQSPVSLAFQVDMETYGDGRRGLREQTTAMAQLGTLNWTNNLTRLSLPDQSTPTEGVLTASSFAAPVTWNASLMYSGGNLNGWEFQAQYAVPSGWQFQAGLQGPLGPSGAPEHQDSYQVSASALKSTGRYGLGVSAQASSTSYSATLQFQISLGREPRTRRWFTDAQPLATSGSVAAVAFLDTRGTGVRGPDDPILEGTRFRVGHSDSASAIQDPAVTLVTRLARSEEVQISLDESSLPDPSQKSEWKGCTIVPRPGKIAQVEFPVTTFGAVNGTTRIDRRGRREELPGVAVELVDAQGRRVKLLRSAYDGFFEFPDLPFGTYTLRIPPQEAARMAIQPKSRVIRVEAGHTFIDGMDLVVETGPEPEGKAEP